MSMKPAVKKKWLTALRSGEYRQAQGRLSTESGKSMCCLGVLCDVVAPQKWDGVGTVVVKGKNTRSRIYGPEVVGPFGEGIERPPKSILDRAGIAEVEASDLATMNDDGASFKDIARWIEEHL